MYLVGIKLGETGLLRRAKTSMLDMLVGKQHEAPPIRSSQSLLRLPSFRRSSKTIKRQKLLVLFCTCGSVLRQMSRRVVSCFNEVQRTPWATLDVSS